MSAPVIEFTGAGRRQFYHLEHRNVHERREVDVRPILDGPDRDQFAAGLGTIHHTMADAAEAEGFRIARDGEDRLLREFSRTAEHHGRMHEALRKEIANPGTAADAALSDAGVLADVYGRILRNTRHRLMQPTAQGMANFLIMQHGRQAAADMVHRAVTQGRDARGRPRVIKCRGAVPDRAIMADADLNLAGGIVENLTNYLFMAFTEPQAPRHYREMFRVQGGINIGLQFLQVLFYSMRGEARPWDGTDGDYGNSGPGVGQLKLPVTNFRSSDNLDIITQARELLVFGAANLRVQQLSLAHDVMHNRLAYGLQVPAPNQVPGLSLVNWPGLTVKAAAATLLAMTSQQLYDTLVAAVMEPTQISNQAFMPDVLGYDVAIETAMKQPMVIGSVTVADSVESFFRKNFPNVELKPMWELNGLFGSGISTIVAYPRGTDAAPVYLMNEPIMLPQYQYGYGVRTDMYSTSAGIVWPAPVGAEVRLITQQ